jgi:hypothetical protein
MMNAIDSGGLRLGIKDDSSRCAGCVSGQWFDSSGTAATGPFTLFTGFDGSPGTTFDAAPLIGGGLAIRRVDAGGSQWVAILGAAGTAPEPAPAWLAPDTELAVVRGGRAYALVPASGADGCASTADVFSPAGSRCGTIDLSQPANVRDLLK